MDIVKLLAVSGSITVLVVVVELIRRGKLKERYALTWFFASIILIVLSLSRGLLETLSRVIGIYYPPSLLFLVAFLFLLLITLHFSAVISSLSEMNKRLAQEVALLRQTVEEMQREKEQRSS